MNTALPIRGPLWLIGLVGLLAGCAPQKERIIRRLATNSESISLPTCPTESPEIPDEAVRKGIYGVVLAGYVVEPDGRVDQIHLEDPRASPLLYQAVKSWLELCRGSSEGYLGPRRFSELFAFRPPAATPEPSAATEAVDEKSPGLTAPTRSPSCLPDRPPPLLPARGTLDVEYVVQPDGRVGEVTRKGGDPSTVRLLKGVRIWLQSCPYAPGTLHGKAVPVKVAQSFTFPNE